MIYDTESVEEDIENILNAYYEKEGIKVFEQHQDEAYYSPSNHNIVLPLREQFKGMEMYYSTKFHETVHSTGKTLKRKMDNKGLSGQKDYAREELVAEMGSSYLMNHFNLSADKINKNESAYIQSWIQVVKDDPRAFVVAAGRAEKACELILGERSGE